MKFWYLTYTLHTSFKMTRRSMTVIWTYYDLHARNKLFWTSWLDGYVIIIKSHKSLMGNYFSKRTSGAPLHTLSKLYDVPVGFVAPLPHFRQWIALFAMAEEWLLLNIRWFVLFLDTARNSVSQTCGIWFKKNCFSCELLYSIMSVTDFWTLHSLPFSFGSNSLF